MKHLFIGFLIGLPFWFAAGLFTVYAMLQEADMRAAKRLLWQIRDGTQSCLIEGRTMNCDEIRKGKHRLQVYTTEK